MLRMLDHDASDALVRPVTLCAGLKFTALLTVVGYLVSTNPPCRPSMQQEYAAVRAIRHGHPHSAASKPNPPQPPRTFASETANRHEIRL